MGIEKRRHERVPTEYVVRLRVADRDDLQEGACVNLSLGGLFIRIDQPLPRGMPVTMELRLDPVQQTIHVEGEVVWTRPAMPDPKFPAGVGVKFTKIDEEALRLVALTIEKQKERLPSPKLPPE